jgi:hypothetical protein
MVVLNPSIREELVAMVATVSVRLVVPLWKQKNKEKSKQLL